MLHRHLNHTQVTRRALGALIGIQVRDPLHECLRRFNRRTVRLRHIQCGAWVSQVDGIEDELTLLHGDADFLPFIQHFGLRVAYLQTQYRNEGVEQLGRVGFARRLWRSNQRLQATRLGLGLGEGLGRIPCAQSTEASCHSFVT